MMPLQFDPCCAGARWRRRILAHDYDRARRLKSWTPRSSQATRSILLERRRLPLPSASTHPWVSIDQSAPIVAMLRAVSSDMLSWVSNSGTIYGGFIETVRDRVASVVVPNRGQLKIVSRVKRANQPDHKPDEEKRSWTA
eukprot:5412633-Amphidinium_carterae.1